MIHRSILIIGLGCILVATTIYGSMDYVSTIETMDDNPQKDKPKGISFQQAQEVNVILQDQSLPNASAKIEILGNIELPKTSQYGNILASPLFGVDDKIAAIQSLVNSNMLKGQLAANTIAADDKLYGNVKVGLIKQFGSPPPVYPGIFNSKSTIENQLAIIGTKNF